MKIFGLRPILIACTIGPLILLIQYYIEVDNEKNIYCYVGIFSLVLLFYAMFFFNLIKISNDRVSFSYFNLFKKNTSTYFSEIDVVEIKHHPLRWSFESITIIKKNGDKETLMLKGAFKEMIKLYGLLKQKGINVSSKGFQKKSTLG